MDRGTRESRVKTRGTGGLWGAEGQGCEGPCAGEELAPGHMGLPRMLGCREWQDVGAESSGWQRGAVALEVMGGSVCPPAECSKWVLEQLALGSLGTWAWGAPAPDCCPFLSGCWRPRQQAFTLLEREGVCFPRPCPLEVRTGGGVTRTSSESELLNHQDGPCHPPF